MAFESRFMQSVLLSQDCTLCHSYNVIYDAWSQKIASSGRFWNVASDACFWNIASDLWFQNIASDARQMPGFKIMSFLWPTSSQHNRPILSPLPESQWMVLVGPGHSSADFEMLRLRHDFKRLHLTPARCQPDIMFQSQASDTRFQNHASDVIFCDHASDLQYTSGYVSRTKFQFWILSGIDQHWLALGIDPGSPEKARKAQMSGMYVTNNQNDTNCSNWSLLGLSLMCIIVDISQCRQLWCCFTRPLNMYATEMENPSA